MGDLLEAQYEMYKEDYESFIKEYLDFQKRNTKRQSNLECSVYTETATTVYMKLNRFIHSAVILYDNKILTKKVSKSDRKFMSGVKHVDNLIKHNKKPLDISELISSTPQFQTSILKVTRKPQLWFDVRLISTWLDLSAVPCEPEWENQRRCYNSYLKGKMIIDTVKQIDEIIKRYMEV